MWRTGTGSVGKRDPEMSDRLARKVSGQVTFEERSEGMKRGSLLENATEHCRQRERQPQALGGGEPRVSEEQQRGQDGGAP